MTAHRGNARQLIPVAVTVVQRIFSEYPWDGDVLRFMPAPADGFVAWVPHSGLTDTVVICGKVSKEHLGSKIPDKYIYQVWYDYYPSRNERVHAICAASGFFDKPA